MWCFATLTGLILCRLVANKRNKDESVPASQTLLELKCEILLSMPYKFRTGADAYKYLLLRPDIDQKRGMIIHIFVSTPRRRSETGRNYSYVRFYAPTETGSGAQSFIYLFLRPDRVWVRRNIEVICPKPINIGSNKE